MKLTSGQYRFNVKNMARDTSDAYSAYSFNSWVGVVRILAVRGFNVWEAEAILRSKTTRWCRDAYAKTFPAANNTLSKYLDSNNITPRSKEVNELVMEIFGREYKLELNKEGVPCRRGTMPGNYHPNKTILVPVGTPCSCDPTSETYWSM